MIQLDLKPKVVKFIQALPPKHRRQIKDYVLNLQHQPMPHDTKPLKGYKPYMRADCGEYRIIYKLNLKQTLLTIVLIGKRNGAEVYKRLKQMLN